MDVILDRYEEADRAFRVGEVLTDDKEKLLEHLSGLSNLTNINTGTQHRDIIRSITINHILLHRHIETLQSQVDELHNHITRLNTGNTKIQGWVIALAVAALIAAAVQTTVVIRSELREVAKTQQVPPKQQLSPPPLAAPILPAAPAPGQPTKKIP